MSVRHEPRRMTRQHAMGKQVSIPASALAPRWSRSGFDASEDDQLYEPDWEVSDQDLETYIDMARDEYQS